MKRSGKALAFSIAAVLPGFAGSIALADSQAKPAAIGSNAASAPRSLSTSTSMLESYTDPSGKSSFAIRLCDPNQNAPPLAAMDIGLIVDLSASQTGARRSTTVEAVRGLVDGLVGGSRVQIWFANRADQAALERPAAVGSKEVAAALATASAAIPSGASDLKSALASAKNWLNDTSGTLPKALVYIGDGRQTTGLDRPLDADLSATLVKQRVPLHGALVGSSLEHNRLNEISTLTGGRVLVADPKGPSPAAILLDALRQPIFYVEKVSISPGVTAAAPQRLPPLRADSATLVVGHWGGGGKLIVALEGVRDGKATQATIELVPLPTNGPNAYLAPLVDRWLSQDDRPAALNAMAALRLAKASSETNAEQLLGYAKSSLADRKLDLAEDLYRAALATEPDNIEAKAGVKAVAQLRTSNDPRRPLDPTPAVGDAAKKSLPPNDPIADARARDRVESQRVQRVVSQAIEEAGRQARSNRPQQALETLKRALQEVDHSPISADSAALLKRRIESQLRQAIRMRLRLESEQINNDRVQAEAQIRRREGNQEQLKQLTEKQLMSRYEQLLGSGLYQQARRVAAQLQDADADSVEAAAASFRAAHLAQFARAENSELRRSEGYLSALASVSDSARPIPDDIPVVFPPAKAWEELTIRREKYKAVDLSPLSPKEQQIRRSLTKPVSFNFEETTLRDVVDFLRDYTAVNIVLDPSGLDESGVSLDTPVSLTLNDVTLKSALNLVLRPLQLAYIIRDDVLFITSQQTATEEMLTKVYPVADLVLQIADFSNIGGLGGLGGGGLGGGGLGGGGLGGGQGGQGGGGLGGGAGAGGGAQGNNDISDELIDLIKSTVKESVWDGNGGKGTIVPFPGQPGNLVVRAPREAAPKKGQKAENKAGNPDAEKDQEKKPVSRNDWESHFKKTQESDRAIQLAVGILSQAQRHGQAADLLGAAIRHAAARPWMFEALALSRQLAGAPNEEVRDALLSLVDLAPNQLPIRLGAANALATAGRQQDALTLARATAERFSGSVNSYFQVLRLSAAVSDVDAMCWSADQILGREWPRDSKSIHQQARTQLELAMEDLRLAGRDADSNRVRRASEQNQRRDLDVTVHWSGEADIDLYVIEPSRTLCSPLTPRTTGGGVLVADSTETGERYVAAEAFSGEYELVLRPIWGTPTGGMTTIDIVRHRGTGIESHERRSIKIDASDAIVKFTLDSGRRQKPAALSPDIVLVDQTEKARPAVNPVMQLRQLIGKSPLGELDDEPGGGAILAPPQGVFAQVVGGGGVVGNGGAVAFDPEITLLFSGSVLQAQAVVSADRRFVRLQMQPQILDVQPRDQVQTIDIQGAAGGGTLILP